MPQKLDSKNIAIIRTDRIGEVLLSTVSIDALKKRYPEANLFFVTSNYSRPIVEERSDIKEIICVDTFQKKGWIKKAVQLAFILRKKKIDIAIILNPHKMLHLASFLAGIPCRIGFNRKWGFLLTKSLKDEREKGEKHEIEYTMELLHLLGVDGESPSPRLIVAKEAEEKINSLLLQEKIDANRSIISVHPGSSNPAKIWPSESYSQLISRITNELNCSVIILGGKEERDMAERIAVGSGKKNVYNLAGLLDLKALAALLKKSSLFIGNDAGPMHMAAALGISVIAIFVKNVKGTGPVRWRPWGDKHAVFYKTQGEITVYKVFEAAKQHVLGTRFQMGTVPH